MATVSVSRLCLKYGETTALDDVSLTFADGRFFGLLGPSGSGKTTLLRCIAGFVFPDSGAVKISGEPVEHIPVEKREIGMMFQSYALFPNMSVADNIGFGLKVRNVGAAETKKRMCEALELVHLVEFAHRRPHQLSGGQKQRVALARAIVTRPRVLLLDEPLSALDKALRVEMQIELKRIQREVGITTIFVTHDQEEALTLSDEVGILRDGKLIQHGPPQSLYQSPANRFCASFLGDANFIDGTAERNGFRPAAGTLLPWPDKTPQGTPKTIVVRPEEIRISTERPAKSRDICAMRGEIRQIVFSGATATCIVNSAGQTLKALLKNHETANLPPSGSVWVSWPARRSIVMPD